MQQTKKGILMRIPIILAIIVWIVHEYTNHIWVNAWQLDTKTTKCCVALLLIVLVLVTPSVETVVANTDVNTFLRRVLVNERYNDVFTSHAPPSPEIFRKMEIGASFVPQELPTAAGGLVPLPSSA